MIVVLDTDIEYTQEEINEMIKLARNNLSGDTNVQFNMMGRIDKRGVIHYLEKMAKEDEMIYVFDKGNRWQKYGEEYFNEIE